MCYGRVYAVKNKVNKRAITNRQLKRMEDCHGAKGVRKVGH
jgi:hypothetical protein